MKNNVDKPIEPYVIHYIDADFAISLWQKSNQLPIVNGKPGIPKSADELCNQYVPEQAQSYDDEYLDLLINKYTPKYDYEVSNKAWQYIAFTEEVERIHYSRKGTPFFFVTINPKPGITVEKLHNTIVKMLSQEGIKDPMWSLEIRAAPDKGLHAHVYFEYNTTDKNFVNRKIKKHFVPDLCQNKKHVDVKWVSADEIQQVQSYILKSVVTTSKKESNIATLAWREKEGIPHPFLESHLLVWDSVNNRELEIDVD